MEDEEAAPDQEGVVRPGRHIADRRMRAGRPQLLGHDNILVAVIPLRRDL